MSFFLRQYWKDERLTYDPKYGVLSLDPGTIAKVWKPDVYILNEKSARKHDITVPNMLMYLYSDGSILYSHR